ncbi:MAG TPA: diacylglycerol kinase family protein [Alphaproteobacteria bacterium]|nr:diacylglycerol kinase family protein [Alphaproteobacteria bacterium]
MKSKRKETKQFIRGRKNSFRYAFAGFLFVLKTQKNAWLHLIATAIVIFVSFWLGIDRIEWLAILLVIGLVWMAEFMNTALEVIVDLASPEKHPLAKVGKDVGAASVLIAAILAVIIGVIVLWQPLIEKLGW